MSGAGDEALRDAVVWLDGRVVGIDEARIPVSDHGLLYGDGIFEGIRVYGGRVFRLDRHLARRRSGGFRARLATQSRRYRALVPRLPANSARRSRGR